VAHLERSAEKIPMKESEFYKRALRDTAFRREKLDELRYSKKVGIGLLCFCISVGTAWSLYAGIREGQWAAGFRCFTLVVFCAGVYFITVTRLAALEAIEAEPNQALEPTSTAVTPPAVAGDRASGTRGSS
jgi:hypothetical protein